MKKRKKSLQLKDGSIDKRKKSLSLSKRGQKNSDKSAIIRFGKS